MSLPCELSSVVRTDIGTVRQSDRKRSSRGLIVLGQLLVKDVKSQISNFRSQIEESIVRYASASLNCPLLVYLLNSLEYRIVLKSAIGNCNQQDRQANKAYRTATTVSVAAGATATQRYTQLTLRLTRHVETCSSPSCDPATPCAVLPS